MRIEIDGNNIVISPELKKHAEARAWLAAQRYRRHISWAGVRFTEYTGQNEPRRTLCQIDLWLRRAGPVTIRRTDTIPYVAVELAAARLRHTLGRQLRRRSAQRPAAMGLHNEWLGRITRPLLSSPPRLAVVVTLNDGQSRLPLRPWLKMRYGTEQIQRVGLSRTEWDALANSSDDVERFRSRLRLALLSWPELILVIGSPDRGADTVTAESRRQETKRIVRRLRLWNLPVEVAGVWTHEAWEPHCLAESEELVALAPQHDGAVWPAERMTVVTPTSLMERWPVPEATQCTI